MRMRMQYLLVDLPVLSLKAETAPGAPKQGIDLGLAMPTVASGLYPSIVIPGLKLWVNGPQVYLVVLRARLGFGLI